MNSPSQIPLPISLTLQETAAYESFYSRLAKAHKDLATAQANLQSTRQQLLGFHLGFLALKELDPTQWKLAEDRRTLTPVTTKPQPSVPSASSSDSQGDSDGFGAPI